jgi:hypothetical protein
MKGGGMKSMPSVTALFMVRCLLSQGRTDRGRNAAQAWPLDCHWATRRNDAPRQKR